MNPTGVEQMNNYVAPGFCILALCSSGSAPAAASGVRDWLSTCIMKSVNHVCTAGSGTFFDDEDCDGLDARLARDARTEGAAIPYDQVRRELGLG